MVWGLSWQDTMDGKKKSHLLGIVWYSQNPDPAPWKSWNLQKLKNVKKRGLYFLFAGLFGTFRRHCHILSIFLKLWQSGALHQKGFMWNQGWLCSSLKRNQGFIFALEYKNNNGLHTMLESWACKKDIKDLTAPTNSWEWAPLSMADGKCWDSSSVHKGCQEG